MSRRLLVAVAAVVVIAAAATVLWFWRPWAGPQPSAASPSSPSSAAPPLTPDAARSLAADLASGDEARVRSAVAVNPGQPLDSNAVAALSAAKPAFDATTFHPTSDTTATVNATIPGPPPSSWLVQLVLADGHWKISTTEPTP